MNKDDVAGLVELKKLQKDAGIPHLPTQLTYQLRRAVAGYGTLAYQWADKPHRLVYDACREIEAQVEALTTLSARVETLEAALQHIRKASDDIVQHHTDRDMSETESAVIKVFAQLRNMSDKALAGDTNHG